jgi:hypothetical protein
MKSWQVLSWRVYYRRTLSVIGMRLVGIPSSLLAWGVKTLSRLLTAYEAVQGHHGYRS